MKKIIYIVLFIIAVCTFAGCDKKDCNGDLDGMWQLVVWTSPEGDTLATKDSMIFYSFQLQMMRFQKLAGKPTGSMLSMFKNYPDSIVVYKPQNYKGNGHDSIYSMTLLEKFGVPSNGRMNIQSLSSGSLVLYSESKGTLRFRKY